MAQYFYRLMLFAHLVKAYIDLACSPHIFDSTPYKDEFRQIECGISTCSNVYRIIYEKTSMYTTGPWTPVFEGINKTNYKALATGDNYTLENRIEYTAFPSKHMLYIKPFIKQDQGKWKCIVYADDNSIYESKTLDVDIYVTPEKTNMNVLQSMPALVTDQEAEFTCLVNGIHPEAFVIWVVNGVEQKTGNAANDRSTDGLWLLNNTINLGFSTAEVYLLRCVITTPIRDPWLSLNITIDVKEKAKVLAPTEPISIKALTNSSFTLDCIGTGYKPDMLWARDDTYIEDTNDSYTIKRLCNDKTCTGSITARTDDLSYESQAVYTCVISLQPPYQSIQASPFMIVNMPQTWNIDRPALRSVKNKTCTEEHRINYLAIVMSLSIVILLCLVLMALAAVCVYMKCEMKKMKDPQEPGHNEERQPFKSTSRKDSTNDNDG